VITSVPDLFHEPQLCPHPRPHLEQTGLGDPEARGDTRTLVGATPQRADSLLPSDLERRPFSLGQPAQQFELLSLAEPRELLMECVGENVRLPAGAPGRIGSRFWLSAARSKLVARSAPVRKQPSVLVPTVDRCLALFEEEPEAVQP
jgi:hypothetical protein